MSSQLLKNLTIFNSVQILDANSHLGEKQPCHYSIRQTFSANFPTDMLEYLNTIL